MFSNQYSNGALAVVREYFCNGDDSRVAAGVERPTEVWLPTELNPTLIVRDFGLGLDADGLETTFATYLLSTKEDDDDATGHFGIGSKAAFTLGQQFTVTGFKGGVMTTTLFALDEKGVAYSDILFEGPTTEPNGVRVEVGVPDVEVMREAAREFFLTVPKGRALVDGGEPEHLFDTVDNERFNDEVVLVKDGQGAIRVQMGPVVYPVTRSILSQVAKRLTDANLPSATVAVAMANWDSDDSVLMEVGMGDVNIAPSREDLRDTESTLNRLSSVVQGIHDFIVTEVQAKIDAAPSRFAAAMVMKDAVENLKGFKVRKSTFTWNGMEKPFPHEVMLEGLATFGLVNYSYRSERKVVTRDDKYALTLTHAPRVLVVAGVSKDETSKVSRYLKRFLEGQESHTGFKNVVVAEETTGARGWFEWGTANGSTTWTLEEYRQALREMRDSDPRTKSEPSYTTGWTTNASRDLDDRDLLTDIISWGKEIIVFHDNPRVYDAEAVAILDQHYTPVVLLGTQSENALRKRVEADGSVKVFDGNWRTIVADSVKQQVTSPTTEEQEAYGAAMWIQENRYSSSWTKSLLQYLSEEQQERVTKHPAVQAEQDTWDLAEMIAASLTDERKAALARLAQWAGVEFSAIPFEVDRKASMSEVWPLFRTNGVDSWTMRRDEEYREAVVSYIESTI
jgi:hypothetical protein